MRATLNDSGTALASMRYDPWGQLQTSAIAPFGFTGELQTGGLVQLRARWYHAGQGTLLGRDPFPGWAEQPQSLAPYTYVHNDPINATDPTGLVRWSIVSSGPYHDWIENQYELTNQVNIHVEFDGFVVQGHRLSSPRIDVLNDATGDVYDIKPIHEVDFTAVAQVTGYLILLKVTQSYGLLNPVHPSGHVYNWNNINWYYGSPANYPPQRWPWASFDLVAMSPFPGIIAYWLEPSDNSVSAWVSLVQSKYRDDIKRPWGWQPGMPVPNLTDPVREPIPPGQGNWPSLPPVQPIPPIPPIPGRVSPLDPRTC